MEKNFFVTVKGLQTFDGDDNANVEMSCEASYTIGDGAVFVEYDEPKASGMEGTTTEIEISDGYVSVTRSGEVKTNMLFIKDKQTTTFYDTPFGTMAFTILTDKLEAEIYDTGCDVTVVYSVNSKGKFYSNNRLTISVNKILTEEELAILEGGA